MHPNVSGEVVLKMSLALLILIVVLALFAYRHFALASAKTIAALAEEGAVVIDVRTPGEYAGGHLEGAANIPLNVIGSVKDGLPEDRKTPILLYCHSGARSASATSILKRAGYENVHNLGSMSRARALLPKALGGS